MFITQNVTLFATEVFALNREALFQQQAAQFGLNPSWYAPTRHAFLMGQGVKIGVVDSGAPSHSFITKRVAKTRCFVPHVGVEDAVGHASQVMGRIVTFAPMAEFYVAKVTHGYSGITMTSVLQAMEWLADLNVDVVNLSLGFRPKGPDGKLLPPCTGTCNFCLDMVAFAQEGITIVTAAGNDGPELGTINCPGSASDIISVGAVDDAFHLLARSSRGRQVHAKPDMLAPGVISGPMGQYSEGTSFAAPVVTGLLAATMGQFNKTEAMSALKGTCRDLQMESYEMGAGLVNPKQYVEVLKSVQLPSANREQRGVGTN